MSTTPSAADQPNPSGSKLWRAPFVGIVTLVAMLLSIGLAHAVMRAIEELGDTTTIELTEVVRNPDLKPSDFDLELPDGVEIIRHSTAAN